MEGEKGKEIQRNSIKWRDLARKAVCEGGSSDKNIDEFIAKLRFSPSFWVHLFLMLEAIFL
ncbi:hypothetical protein ACE6H2_027605 [Prunus campanulata]